MSRFDLFFVVLDECEENSDRKIAEHIVRVHQKKDLALNPPYSASQLQRYIKFARCIDPKWTLETKKILVEQYKKLRQADATGGSKSSYRITVRQLESIIRLSEALARLYCEETILTEHVYEAVRLLKTSIINVESSDVQLSELRSSKSGDSQSKNSKSAGLSDSNKKVTDNNNNKQEEAIKFSDYSKIMTALLQRVDVEESGISQQALCDWYLKNHDDITSQQQLVQKQVLIHKLVQHMLDVDKTLLAIAPSENFSERILIKNLYYEL